MDNTVETAGIMKPIMAAVKGGARKPKPAESVAPGTVIRKDPTIGRLAFNALPTLKVDAVEVDAVEKYTDEGNSNRFVRLHDGNVVWTRATMYDGWNVWTGSRWVPDQQKQVDLYARKVTAELRLDAEKQREKADNLRVDMAKLKAGLDVEGAERLQIEWEKAEGMAKASEKWAKDSAMSGRMSSMVRLAEARSPGPLEWDPDPFLLGTPAGTLDLRTGKVKPPKREEWITKQTGVNPASVPKSAYNPDKSVDWSKLCSRWIDHLNQTMRYDVEMVEYLQVLCGYMLTGDTSEHKLFVMHGATGRNGKSTFLNVVKGIMGDYADGARHQLITAKEQDPQIPNEIAATAGKRALLISEAPDHARLDAARVKSLTGGDMQRGRFLNKEYFDFKPQAKVLFIVNVLFGIPNDDPALLARLHLIPFLAHFPDGEGQIKSYDRLILEEEGPAVLSWALEGAKKWAEGTSIYQKGKPGLWTPKVVADELAKYRKDQDTLGEFIGNCLRPTPGGFLGKNDLQAVYTEWCNDRNDKHPMQQKTLTNRLKLRDGRKNEDGVEETWGDEAGGERRWKGWTLAPKWADRLEAVESRRNRVSK